MMRRGAVLALVSVALAGTARSEDALVIRDGTRRKGVVAGCREDACTLDGAKVARGLIAWVGLRQDDAATPPVRDPTKDEAHLVDGRVVNGEFGGLSLGAVAVGDSSFDRDEVAWIRFAGPEPAASPRASPAGPYYRFSPSPPASGSPRPSAPPTPPTSTPPPPGASPSPPPPPSPGTGALWTGTIRGRYWGTVGGVTTELLVTVDVKLRETAPIPLTAPGTPTVIGRRVNLDPAGSTITNKMTASSPEVSCRGIGTTTHPGNTAGRQDGLLMTKTRNGDTRGLAGIDIPLGRTLYGVAYLHVGAEFTYECRSQGVTETSKIGYTVPPLGRVGLIAYDHNGDPEFRFVQGTGTMAGSYQASSIIAFQQMSAEWSICREGTNCPPPREPGPSASPTPSPDPCGDLARARSLVDVLWDQRQSMTPALENAWRELKSAHDEMLFNLEAWRAAIPICAIADIVQTVLTEAAGAFGEALDLAAQIAEGDLSYLNQSDEVGAALEVLGGASAAAGAGNPANMRDRLAGCAALPENLRAGANAFVDNYEKVLQLMPQLQEHINDIRSKDQEHWDEWNRYYRACLEYAQCKGLPASTCPRPPSAPSGPMPRE